MGLRGEKVTVIRKVEVGRDAGNSPIYEEKLESVSNVLIAPGPRKDIIESNRPLGVEVAYNLKFPKAYKKPLRDCDLLIYGERLTVVGDPKPYPPHLTPGPWNLPVEVKMGKG